MTIGEAISYGTAVLQDNEVIEPRRESSLLLSLATQKDRAYLIAHPEEALSQAAMDDFHRYIRRRAAHEPFQYISGRQEFYGLDFDVSPDVLIPRPETEILVEKAIEKLNDKVEPRFCEIGIGSGCISVAILRSVKAARAVSVTRAAPTAADPVAEPGCRLPGASFGAAIRLIEPAQPGSCPLYLE